MTGRVREKEREKESDRGGGRNVQISNESENITACPKILELKQNSTNQIIHEV